MRGSCYRAAQVMRDAGPWTVMRMLLTLLAPVLLC